MSDQPPPPPSPDDAKNPTLTPKKANWLGRLAAAIDDGHQLTDDMARREIAGFYAMKPEDVTDSAIIRLQQILRETVTPIVLAKLSRADPLRHHANLGPLLAWEKLGLPVDQEIAEYKRQAHETGFGGSESEHTSYMRAVEKVRDNLKAKPHAINTVLQCYRAFIREHGRLPAKPELKDAVVEIAKRHRLVVPQEDDGKGWTRLWQAARLTFLHAKRPAKGSKPRNHKR